MRIELLLPTLLTAASFLIVACAECANSADCDIGEVCVSGNCESRDKSPRPGNGGGVDSTDAPGDGGDTGGERPSLPPAVTADYAAGAYEARKRGCLEDAFSPSNPAVFVDEDELFLFFTEPSSATAGGLDLWMSRSDLDDLAFGPKEIVSFDAGPMDFARNGDRTFIIAAQDPTSAVLLEGDDRAQNWSLEAIAASQEETVGLCLNPVRPVFARPLSNPVQALVGFEEVTGAAVCRYRSFFWDFDSEIPVAVASGPPAGAVFFDDRFIAATTSNLSSASSESGPFERLEFDTETAQGRAFHRLVSDEQSLYALTSSPGGFDHAVSLLLATRFDDWDTNISFPNRLEDESKTLSRADMTVGNGLIAVSWLLEDIVAVLTVSTDNGTTWSTPASFIVPVEGAAPRDLALTTDGAYVYGAFQVGGPPEVEDTRICFTAFEPPDGGGI